MRLILLTLAFPIRFAVTFVVTLFDLVLSRYFIVLPFVALIWMPLHFLVGLGLAYLIWPTIILGTMLAGLWEGCGIMVIHPRIPAWLLFKEPLPYALPKDHGDGG